MTYGQDKKWVEAKKFIEEQDMKNNWIEVVDYYRQLGGKHVCVFIALDKKKYMILEATTNNKVILVDKDNNIVLEDYTTVFNSRKMFYYIQKPFEVKLDLSQDIHKITYNNSKKLTFTREGE